MWYLTWFFGLGMIVLLVTLYAVRSEDMEATRDASRRSADK